MYFPDLVMASFDNEEFREAFNDRFECKISLSERKEVERLARSTNKPPETENREIAQFIEVVASIVLPRFSQKAQDKLMQMIHEEDSEVVPAGVLSDLSSRQ